MDLLALLVAAVVGQLFNDAISFAAAYVAVRLIEFLIKRRKFGGWTLRVLAPDGAVATERLVGMKKMEQVLDDDSDLSVFVKGVASTFGWINLDPVVKGREIGLLVVDKRQRLIVVDLTKNPAPPPKQANHG